MASVFLSPSTQEYNQFVNGGTEEYYTNLIADAMVPYLRAAGIDFSRNNPNGTVIDSVNASNSGNYDFHLAIHTNAAPANPAAFRDPMSTITATALAAKPPQKSLRITSNSSILSRSL